MAYAERFADSLLSEILNDFAAVMITGPRAAGKTTTALRHVASVARLDEPSTAASFRADVDAALRRLAKPALVDEWQEVPEVLGAVKRSVDRDSSPGQFILTGSVRAELQQQTWAGTGRVVRMSMYGVAERELHGPALTKRAPFLERLPNTGLSSLSLPDPVPVIDDYIELALRGGFPELVYRERTARSRRIWMAGYLDDLVTRDAESVAHLKDPDKLRAYLHALALNNAGIPTETTLYTAAGINAKTAASYDRLLSNLYVVGHVPAWPTTTNRLTALVKAPKRYLVDTAIAAAAATLTTADVLSDPALTGRFFDALVLGQLRPELALMDPPPLPYHLRTQGGRQEVDLIFDLGAGRVVALECKASSVVDKRDARHLFTLREELGSRFLGGAVIHTGPELFQLGDRVFAVPLCAVWG